MKLLFTIYTLLFLAFSFITITAPVFADDTPTDPLTLEEINSYDPLIIGQSTQTETFSRPAGIINRALVFAFPIAGLILFLMIVVGGFQMLSGAATKKSMDDGKKRITAAVIGFLLLFASYWIIQIIEVIFGVGILNTG